MVYQDGVFQSKNMSAIAIKDIRRDWLASICASAITYGIIVNRPGFVGD